MRLKRLELQGYKSFASRIEFLFPTGITAIVGPNGSGKSNVADGIRWALGEQSLRSLRGKTTEDMIFSGSRRRSRAGMAEVLVTLDNSDGWLPVDFSEVTVGRRAYRSGSSEYLLNGSRVRLRDVNHLLAESGLSQRTYAVIGQGLIDTALSLRPQERRVLFEEAAGIAVYRSQRGEAATRLDETERNLERVRDILGEILPNLERLGRQVERLREHERVSAHLQRVQRVWYGYYWGQAQEALRTARERARVLEEKLADLRVEAAAVGDRLTGLRRRQAELRAGLRDAYRHTADLHDQTDAAQRELATLTERVRLFRVQREEHLRELEPLLSQVDAQAGQLEAARSSAEALRGEAAAKEARITAVEDELRQLREQARHHSARSAEVGREVEALKARRAELERAIVEARDTQVRLEAEAELLARLREEGGILNQGVRTLLEAGLDGAAGLLGALVRVPQEWETALEAALAARAQALVVRDWGVVSAARSALPADERAMLLPLADAPDRGRAGPEPSRVPEGAQRASDVVTCPLRLQSAVETLLGQTLLVQDLATARALQNDLPPGGQCVTRDGEVLAADGTVTVGRLGGGVLTQERAWRELPHRLEAARERQAELVADSARVAERLAVLETAVAEAEREAAEAARKVAQVEGGPLAEARTELAVARQALESQQSLVRRETLTFEGIESQVAARRTRVEELEAEQAAAEARLDQLRQQTGDFQQQLAEERARIEPAEEKLERLNREQERVEQDERRLRERLRRAEERVNNASLDVARQQDHVTRLQERIEEDLGLVELEVADQVTAQTALPLRPLVSPLPIVELLPEGLGEEIQRLKARLRQLGPVNPTAAQDHAEMLERHQFLTGQVEDLQSASARLRDVIAQLDEMMEQAFRETFDAVATAFEEMFVRLFGGGSARLELTEPDDLMVSGVDIVARPPGKRLQSLALLSGGERALSAAALIFAILRVRPTPVCVLDEVDAMLDEANVARFREMLRELAQETQFVVITHNRHTVEAAGTVYGVSMGSDGVSHVVSLRMVQDEELG